MDIESDSTVVQILGPKKRVRECKRERKKICVYCEWLNVWRKERRKRKKKILRIKREEKERVEKRKREKKKNFRSSCFVRSIIFGIAHSIRLHGCEEECLFRQLVLGRIKRELVMFLVFR